MLVNLLSVVALAVAASSIPSALAKPTACRKAQIENLIVFGDSYSDTGNEYKLSNKTWPLPSYDHGRFSNGPVWPERVASAKKYKLQNYAFAAATSDSKLVQGYSGPSSTIAVPGFIQQIESYYQPKANRKHAEKSLFVVNFQGNDFFFDPSLDPQLVVNKLRDGINRLVKLGARNILVVKNINYGLIPYFNTNATIAAAYTQIAGAEQKDYQKLEKLIRELKNEYSIPSGTHPFVDCKGSHKINISFMNLEELFKELYQPSQLKRLGITDVVNGCVSNDYTTVCKDAGKHFYWDAFHPTTKIHNEIAKAILHIL
ncbi:GDSL lipase/esterase [Dissophora ornata]|nr:hypothetical protein BGZ58_010684 [Dissophora ornata]KAI8596968.1 GDSL lipase/esterase [Dissophora ornata]